MLSTARTASVVAAGVALFVASCTHDGSAALPRIDATPAPTGADAGPEPRRRLVRDSQHDVVELVTHRRERPGRAAVLTDADPSADLVKLPYPTGTALEIARALRARGDLLEAIDVLEFALDGADTEEWFATELELEFLEAIVEGRPEKTWRAIRRTSQEALDSLADEELERLLEPLIETEGWSSAYWAANALDGSGRRRTARTLRDRIDAAFESGDVAASDPEFHEWLVEAREREAQLARLGILCPH